MAILVAALDDAEKLTQQENKAKANEHLRVDNNSENTQLAKKRKTAKIPRLARQTGKPCL